MAESDGKVTIQYKEYGVRLNFTPVVLDNGLINLKLEPEVSQIDPNTVFRTALVEIPAFITRRASTTIEVRDGQSFAMAGLLQTLHTKSQDQLPWLGQVPVLGALFRSSSFQEEETDLVIIVTPHLVRPAKPGQPLRTSLDAAKPSNDAEFFLLGNLAFERAGADPAHAASGWLPLAAAAWARCLEIGERPDLESSMHGCGSHLARHNLAAVQAQLALPGCAAG